MVVPAVELVVQAPEAGNLARELNFYNNSEIRVVTSLAGKLETDYIKDTLLDRKSKIVDRNFFFNKATWKMPLR